MVYVGIGHCNVATCHLAHSGSYVVLRKLLGRPVVSVIMATIGLASLIRGVATLVFGAGVRAIPLPISDDPLFLGPVMLPPVQLAGAGVSIVFLAGFTWFFLKTRMGVAM